jgi:hypothetical protein
VAILCHCRIRLSRCYITSPQTSPANLLLLIRWWTGTSQQVDFIYHIKELTLEDSLAFILSFYTLDKTVHGHLPLK